MKVTLKNTAVRGRKLVRRFLGEDMQRRILAAALGASLLLVAACGDERAADVTTSSVAVDTTVAADTTVGADST
ncbi:MAG: hypothetical protein IPP16_21105 [Acidimicrobiaceae bacterium]|nr:hypothetical protein [Acidimicrobiaceae bacterium]